MSSRKRFGISFGVLAPDLRTQIAAQGFRVRDLALFGHLERDRQALVRLKVRGVITESAAKRGFLKTLRAIEKVIEPAEK